MTPTARLVSQIDRDTFTKVAALMLRVVRGGAPDAAHKEARLLADELYGDPEPRGEWRRGWLSKITGVFAKMEPDDLHRWECIEYRVVGEGGEKAKHIYGVQWLDGSVSTAEDYRRALDQVEVSKGAKLVRLTVEPVEGVGK